MADSLAKRLGTLELGPPTITYLSIDTEGVARTGLRQVAAVDIDNHDAFFFDTVTPVLKTQNLAPSDASRTWSHVGRRFWEWVGTRGDVVVLVGHNIRAHDMPLLSRESAIACPDAFEKIKKRLFIVDTLDATRTIFPITELRDRRQAAVYAHLFGAEPLQKHTALGDARANAAIATHERVVHFVRDRTNWTAALKPSPPSSKKTVK